MNRKGHSKRKLIVNRTFEPNRQSQDILAQAYEQLVSQDIRVINVTTDKSDQKCNTYKSDRKRGVK